MLMTPEELVGRENAVPESRRPTNVRTQKFVKVRGGTRRERRMLLAVALLFLLALILVIVLIAVHTKYEQANKVIVSYCNKEECIKSGAELVQALDRRVDPCTDFYRFACGRWGRQHPVADRRSSSSWFSERGRYLDLTVTEVLATNGTENEPSTLQLTRSLYVSCVDTATQDETGLNSLAEALAMAGFSLAPPGSPGGRGDSKKPLGEALALVQRLLSLDVILQLSTIHDRNNTVRMLRVSPAEPAALSTQMKEAVAGAKARMWARARARAGPGPGGLVPDPEDELLLSSARPSASQVFKAELLFMARVTHLLANADRPDDVPEFTMQSATEAATKVLLFESHLRNSTARLPARPKSMNTTWYDFQKILDAEFVKGNSSKEVSLDLEQYVTKLSAGLNHTIDFENDVIYLSDVPYFKRTAQLLARERTVTAQRYLWWRTVYALLPYTTTKLRGIERKFHEKLVGARPRTPRSQVCTSLVKDMMPAAVSFAMGHRYPLDDAVAMVEEILSDIRRSFRDLVREAKWMDKQTQDATIDKMYAVTSFVGYPDWLNDPTYLDRRYEGLQLEPTQYLKNYMNLKSLTVKQVIESLGVNDSSEPLDLWETIDPIQVNAFYTRISNSIVIPAGILQNPFFRRGHGALSYGAIGAILGHELTHGFDNEGRRYDKHGRRVSWWSRKSESEYNKRAECFVQQYDRFRMPGRNKLDGELTLGENIADNGGVREALHAYRSFTQRHGKESPPPGLAEYSPEQLFFLGFANLWCHEGTPAYDSASVKDRHSPARFRVLGTLANSPEFAQVWGCSATSPMNPENKCIIW